MAQTSVQMSETQEVHVVNCIQLLPFQFLEYFITFHIRYAFSGVLSSSGLYVL